MVFLVVLRELRDCIHDFRGRHAKRDHNLVSFWLLNWSPRPGFARSGRHERAPEWSNLVHLFFAAIRVFLHKSDHWLLYSAPSLPAWNYYLICINHTTTQEDHARSTKRSRDDDFPILVHSLQGTVYVGGRRSDELCQDVIQIWMLG